MNNFAVIGLVVINGRFTTHDTSFLQGFGWLSSTQGKNGEREQGAREVWLYSSTVMKNYELLVLN